MRRPFTVARPRGPVMLWALVAVVAFATGTAYASGFVSSSATTVDTDHGAATPLLGEPSHPEFDLYPRAVTTTDLVIGFGALWGQLAHDTNVFTIAIPADDARTGSPYPGGATFSVDVFSTNQPDLTTGAGGHTPWTDLTIEWTIAPCAGGVFHDEAATTPTFSSPAAQAVMATMTGVVHVELVGLAPGTVYCAGVKQAYPYADDVNGTYITRPFATDAEAAAANPAFTSAMPVAPLFTAVIRRTS